MPENVKNKPYLLNCAAKITFFPHTTERAFFFFLITALRLPKTQE